MEPKNQLPGNYKSFWKPTFSDSMLIFIGCNHANSSALVGLSTRLPIPSRYNPCLLRASPDSCHHFLISQGDNLNPVHPLKVNSEFTPEKWWLGRPVSLSCVGSNNVTFQGAPPCWVQTSGGYASQEKDHPSHPPNLPWESFMKPALRTKKIDSPVGYGPPRSWKPNVFDPPSLARQWNDTCLGR